MKIKKFSFLATIGFLTLFTIGCMPNITVVEPDDKPNLNEKIGYIALSSTCTGYDHAAIGIAKSSDKLFGVDYESIYLNCENDGIQYILLKKKPGIYDIGMVSLSASDFSNPYTQKKESHSRVQVKQGRVTYAGRINLLIEFPSDFYINKQNRYANDIKTMKAIYHNINFNNTFIDINPFR